jgi:hypothetical protein
MESPLPFVDYQDYERKSSYILSSIQSDNQANSGK